MRRLLRTPGVGEPWDEGVWSNAGVPVDISSFQEASSRRTRTLDYVQWYYMFFFWRGFIFHPPTWDQ